MMKARPAKDTTSQYPMADVQAPTYIVSSDAFTGDDTAVEALTGLVPATACVNTGRRAGPAPHARANFLGPTRNRPTQAPFRRRPYRLHPTSNQSPPTANSGLWPNEM